MIKAMTHFYQLYNINESKISDLCGKQSLSVACTDQISLEACS